MRMSRNNSPVKSSLLLSQFYLVLQAISFELKKKNHDTQKHVFAARNTGVMYIFNNLPFSVAGVDAVEVLSCATSMLSMLNKIKNRIQAENNIKRKYITCNFTKYAKSICHRQNFTSILTSGNWFNTLLVITTSLKILLEDYF